MGDNQGKGEFPGQERLFTQEAPVHCPLEQELPGEFKGPGNIAFGVCRKKWKSDDCLAPSSLSISYPPLNSPIQL